MAVAALPATSCLIDGEAIVCDETGLAVFDLIRGHRPLATAVHCAFDLIELDGEDLRRQPIEVRKARLRTCCAAPIQRSCSMSITRATARSYYQHACKLGCEGIVSKRLARRLGRSPHWVKVKNPAAPAVQARGRGRLEPLGAGQCFVEYSTCLRVFAVSLTTEPSGPTWKPSDAWGQIMEVVNEEWPCWPDDIDLRERDDGTEEILVRSRAVAYLDVELAEQRVGS